MCYFKRVCIVSHSVTSGSAQRDWFKKKTDSRRRLISRENQEENIDTFDGWLQSCLQFDGSFSTKARSSFESIGKHLHYKSSSIREVEVFDFLLSRVLQFRVSSSSFKIGVCFLLQFSQLLLFGVVLLAFEFLLFKFSLRSSSYPCFRLPSCFDIDWTRVVFRSSCKKKVTKETWWCSGMMCVSDRVFLFLEFLVLCVASRVLEFLVLCVASRDQRESSKSARLTLGRTLQSFFSEQLSSQDNPDQAVLQKHIRCCESKTSSKYIGRRIVVLDGLVLSCRRSLFRRRDSTTKFEDEIRRRDSTTRFADALDFSRLFCLEIALDTKSYCRIWSLWWFGFFFVVDVGFFSFVLMMVFGLSLCVQREQQPVCRRFRYFPVILTVIPMMILVLLITSSCLLLFNRYHYNHQHAIQGDHDCGHECRVMAIRGNPSDCLERDTKEEEQINCVTFFYFFSKT